MTNTLSDDRSDQLWRRPRVVRYVTLAIVAIGACLRLSAFLWSDPWGPHHPDEHILPLEAVALWEGISPREIGWPASTTRLALTSIEGVELLASRGADLWRARSRPDEVLSIVSSWIGRQFIDPTDLYRTGRALSMVIGILQLLVLVWALRQWLDPVGTAAGALGVAIAAVPVLYSQYVLSDIAGLFFATIVAGLAAAPTERRTIAMSAVAGLAAASKFHFGLWLLAPLLASTRLPFGSSGRIRTRLLSVGATIAVVLALVPWFWINPLLALKEFLGVVGVKVSNGSLLVRLIPNATLVVLSLGAVTAGGMVAALFAMKRPDWTRFSPLLAPVFVAGLALIASGTVFERYGLVLLPGAAIVSGFGWQRCLTGEHRTTRRVAATALLGCLVLTIASLVTSVRTAAEPSVDSLAKAWILTHVPRGSRVAVHDEMNANLPRSRQQLSACIALVDSPAAYRRKWDIDRPTGRTMADEPMRSVLLNDELFSAYWCRREQSVQDDPGYDVILYHNDARFWAILEKDAIREFVDGTGRVAGRLDVLVLNREVSVGIPPATILSTRSGRRVIYEK